MGTSNAMEKPQLEKTLKEGERILGPTRRPDGTLRKPVRIRAGYVPQDEVAVYQSKGSIWKKEVEALQRLPPGYDPDMVTASKPKSKSAKRNEKKKEKRQQQATLENGVSSAEASNNGQDNVESVVSEMNELTISANSSTIKSRTLEDQIQDIDKKIRGIKKKIRLTEGQQQKVSEKDMNAEQLEKVGKLDGWREELKLLENERASIA